MSSAEASADVLPEVDLLESLRLPGDSAGPNLDLSEVRTRVRVTKTQ